MKRIGEKVLDRISEGLILAVFLLCAVIAIPFIPFIVLHAHLSEKQFLKRYHAFLAQMNGACFFCYNNRKSSVEFARDVIVPELPASVHIVFVDGSKVMAGANSEYLSRMLYGITERKGFPYLLKIEAGQVVDLSVNNQFYSVMVGGKSIAPLVERIYAFFGSAVSLAK